MKQSLPQGVGFGKTGLVDDLRTFVDLQHDSLAPRDVYVDQVLGLAFTKDGTYSGAVYYADFAVSTKLYWVGRIRPIVGVEAMKFPRALTQVQRIDDMKPGMFFVDDLGAVLGGTVRLYFELPDDSDPGGAELIAHLLFNWATAMQRHPLFGDEIASDPTFDEWTNPTTPVYWTGSGVAASGVALAQDTELAPGVRGNYSLKISPGASGLPTNTSGGAQEGTGSSSLQDGRHYALAVCFKTPPEQPSGLVPCLRVRGNAGAFMLQDGIRTTSSPNVVNMHSTLGAIRRALFVLRAPASNALGSFHVRLNNTTGATISTGWVKYFLGSIRPIKRYLAYDALLEMDGLPNSEFRSASIGFGEKTLSVGSVRILDPGDKSLLKAFGSLYPNGKSIYIRTGGTFHSGQVLRRDDWGDTSYGLVKQARMTDMGAKIQLYHEDTRSLAYAEAAANKARPVDLSAMNVKDGGKTKALLFGRTSDPLLRAIRVDVDATKGYGVYEFVDPTVPVRDGVSVGLPITFIPAAYPKIYPTEEFADKDELGFELSQTITGNTLANPTVVTTSRRHGLTTGDAVTIQGSNSTPTIDGRRTVTVISATTFSVAVNVTVAGTAGKFLSHADIDYSNNNTRWTVKRDIRNFGRDKAGNPIGIDFVVSFVFGGVTFTTAPINIDGPAWRVAADLQAAMRLAAGGVTTINVSYSESTHRFTISRTGVGNLQLLTQGAAAAATVATAMKGVWKTILGYNTSSDHTGATSYTSDDAMFEDADRDHIIRWPGDGFYDDASGTISGIASAPIDNWPAINSWLLQKVLNVPPSRIILASVRAARLASLGGDLAQIFLYVPEGFKVLELLRLGDQVGCMDTVIQGDGRVRMIRHSDTAVVRRSFVDSDYTAFEMWTDPEDIYKAVRVWGGQDPTQDRFTNYIDGTGVSDPATEIKHGTVKILDLFAGLVNSVISGGTCVVGNTLTRLFKQAPPLVEFGCVGKMVDLLPGDRIEITADRALTSSGELNQVNFRVLGVNVNHGTGEGKCLAVKDVTIHS